MQSAERFPDVTALTNAASATSETGRSRYIRWFRDIRLSDIPQVGGKTASLGELYNALGGEGVRVPNGFALTADAYRAMLDANGLRERAATILSG